MPLFGHKIETTCDNFGALVRENCLMVDKTLIIKEFLERQKVTLITRPRRFGKTTTLSMLQHFLSSEVAGVKTEGLFNELAIAKVDNGEFLKKHQGQYPVIFITFKDTKESSYEETINQLYDLVKKLYREHEKSLSSDKISDSYKETYTKYLDGSVNVAELQNAIAFLSEFLFQVYKKNVFILIDEYDTPLTSAYIYTPKNELDSETSFICRLSDFMRNLFSSALKTNSFLEKGLITGILRVSKNNMLSGLNNLDIYTVLGNEYAQYFGFTEEETKELLSYKKNTTPLEDIRNYYNGYKIGGQIIYNPWSFMKFLDKNELAPYWVRTSNDSAIRDHLIGCDEKTKEDFRALMLGETITGEIDVNLCYEDLMDKPSALWTLLLFCGYLTTEGSFQEYGQTFYQLRVPNEDIMDQYKKVFAGWLKDQLGQSTYYIFLSALLKGDVAYFMQNLSQYLMNSLSFHDVKGRSSEKFYHGFVLGLIASIRETHFVLSNGESGKGLYDVMLIPKDNRYSLGIIVEFKYTKTESELKQKTHEAITQILDKQYDVKLREYAAVKQVLKMGIAFCDKAVLSAHQVVDLTQKSLKKDGDINAFIWSDVYEKDEES